jgi:hypothetical protein
MKKVKDNKVDKVEIEDCCAICLESLNSLGIETLICNHKFHRDCIRHWDVTIVGCPTCRHVPTLEELCLQVKKTWPKERQQIFKDSLTTEELELYRTCTDKSLWGSFKRFFRRIFFFWRKQRSPQRSPLQSPIRRLPVVTPPPPHEFFLFQQAVNTAPPSIHVSGPWMTGNIRPDLTRRPINAYVPHGGGTGNPQVTLFY